MSCDNDARAPNLGAKANGGEKKHIHLFAGLKEETLLQISSPIGIQYLSKVTPR